MLPVENRLFTRYNIPDYIRLAYTTSTEFIGGEVVPSYNHFVRALSRQAINFNHQKVHNSSRSLNGELSRDRGSLRAFCAFDRFSEER